MDSNIITQSERSSEWSNIHLCQHQWTDHEIHFDGNLGKKVKPDGSKTIYPSATPQTPAASLRAGSGGIYEVDKTAGGAVTRTVTCYPVAGAMRINSTLYYILKDHLGSASVITNDQGVEVGTQRYFPYGKTRLTTGTIYTDKLFTRWVEPVETGQRNACSGLKITLIFPPLACGAGLLPSGRR